MRNRLWVFLGLGLAAVLLVAARQQWPASIIVFSDSETLQAKLDAGSLEANTYSFCKTLYAPGTFIAATDDIASIWRAPAAMTITNIWCESPVSTVTINLQRDDGTPADIATADLACASTAVDACAAGCTTTLVDSEDNVADGETLDLDIASIGTEPTTVTVCFEATYD